MKIINGKKIADQILADLKKKIEKKKAKPCLAVILIGKNPASRLYLSLKEKAAQQVGIKVKKYIFSNRAKEIKILELVNLLNQNPEINGILVQLPLLKGISPDKIIKAIGPAKDVDGFLPQSRFISPFIQAIWQALQTTKENIKSKKTVALVNSEVFGRPLVRFLKEKGLNAVYVILQDSSLTLRMTKGADILITALGRPNFIKGSMIKQGAILIDGGITKKGKKVMGDIDTKSVNKKASWLSPVPGGVGPLTVAFLLKNIVLASH